MDYREIPRFPHAAYEVDVQWPYLEGHLSSCEGLNLNPDYQREHVWTTAQQTSYIEFCLRGGEVGRTVIVNAPEWHDLSYRGAELVDGKQRLEAIRKFMRDEVLVFGGHKRSEITGSARLFMSRIRWRVVELKTRDDVLDFYLSINSGGTPHTAEEIARVRAMLGRSGARLTHEQRALVLEVGNFMNGTPKDYDLTTSPHAKERGCWNRALLMLEDTHSWAETEPRLPE